eukprot:Tbor_TRINITY_DN5619_c0_g2::TRINITY_DN5619_c0_g2_i1::g.8386::m.8386
MSDKSDAPPAPFLETYADKNPLATFLLCQWKIFKSKLEKAVAEKNKVSHDLKIGIAEGDGEKFVNEESTACTFAEAGDIGKSFLAYIKEELGKKNWGGKFNYKMSGLGRKGHMHVTAVVEILDGHPSSTMDVKPFFHIK